ncbi:MAG: hypothetical protein ACE5Z5_07575 [Candidatus Bathyarchaeia archaeon]
MGGGTVEEVVSQLDSSPDIEEGLSTDDARQGIGVGGDGLAPLPVVLDLVEHLLGEDGSLNPQGVWRA